MKRHLLAVRFATLVFVISFAVVTEAYAQPYTCVLWPLYTGADGSTLYYSDYYPTACTDQPQVTYAYGGSVSWPQTCPMCFTAGTDDNDPKANNTADEPFRGLDQGLRPGDPIAIPSGKPTDNARVIVDNEIPFMAMVDLAGRRHVAKVFLLALDKDAVVSGVPTGPDRFIYIAEEITGTPPVGATVVTAVASRPLDREVPCYAYDCTCKVGASVVHVLTALVK